ncbi:hypothetical protein H6F42_18845 [Pseudanabaena sp. FACHB-1998]|uniref:hypothetical protein n=1 Tax=Pseudanabaena sp. FACHB-1998 TaxID=2692858 RepID=UPI0016810CBC|nr:hypothetical protein [Pseudanabaena sp. FACHB-1998]MBD2178984.1 hypothetical protein [Pseudanabaena sp. FACHB-1998]
MFTLVVPPESPCGCGSGRAFGECCLQNGHIRLSHKNIIPKPPRTGLSLKKCFLSDQNDCGGNMSGEHILSASVLRNISNDKISINGSNFSRTHSIQSDSLKTKCLCKRHNSAFSPIDTEASRLFKTISLIEKILNGSIQSSQSLYFFAGFDIERWLLKALFATYRSRITNINPDNYTLPCYLKYFFDTSFNPPYGLYLPAKFTSDEQFQFKMSTIAEASFGLITKNNLVSGITINLGGIELKLMVAGTPSDLAAFQKTHVFRPKFINFYQGDEVFSIALAWDKGTEQCVWISRYDPTAPIPKDM